MSEQHTLATIRAQAAKTKYTIVTDIPDIEGGHGVTVNLDLSNLGDTRGAVKVNYWIDTLARQIHISSTSE